MRSELCWGCHVCIFCISVQGLHSSVKALALISDYSLSDSSEATYMYSISLTSLLFIYILYHRMHETPFSLTLSWDVHPYLSLYHACIITCVGTSVHPSSTWSFVFVRSNSFELVCLVCQVQRRSGEDEDPNRDFPSFSSSITYFVLQLLSYSATQILPLFPHFSPLPLSPVLPGAPSIIIAPPPSQVSISIIPTPNGDLCLVVLPPGGRSSKSLPSKDR